MFDITYIPVPLRDKVKTIEDWLKFNQIEKYKLHACRNRVDIFQDVVIRGILKNIPIKIGILDGDLTVSHNHLMTSFKNMPDSIKGSLIANSIGISEIDYFPSSIDGGVTMNNCKSLTDISGIAPENRTLSNLTVSFSAINSIRLPNVTKITGDLNMSANNIATIDYMTTKIEVGDAVTLSDNLISNTKMFEEALIAKHYDFYGNPCKSIDEWETTCNW